MFVRGRRPPTEALSSVPLIARSAIKGALNIYRLGDSASFSDVESSSRSRFGDARRARARQRADSRPSRAPGADDSLTDSSTTATSRSACGRSSVTRAARRLGRSADADIDDFKIVNGRLRHGPATRCCAASPRRCLDRRATDVVCRLAAGVRRHRHVLRPTIAQLALAASPDGCRRGLRLPARGRVSLSIDSRRAPSTR